MTEKDDKQREQKEVGLYEKIAARTAECETVRSPLSLPESSSDSSLSQISSAFTDTTHHDC